MLNIHVYERSSLFISIYNGINSYFLSSERRVATEKKVINFKILNSLSVCVCFCLCVKTFLSAYLRLIVKVKCDIAFKCAQ